MNGKIARSIAAVAVGSLLLVATGGMASAGTLGGKGTSSTEAAGAEVLELRDHLTKVAYAGDVKSTKDALQRLDPLLGDLSAGQVYAIQADAQETAGTAQGHRSETARVLADPSATARQVPAVPGLPPLPDPLSMVSELLQTLLSTLTSLVSGLLGSAPALPVPELPVPEVPAP
ncbi:hypothetical protein SAMN05216266_12746 [Amycolatopsis marina]|uniref:Uncharacterized protein n=1 Tax=Amycolatopsis marina TaxID=490629 RepID=A0A1I1CES3_9PSEU|nr:hypothetical protein [Amycolatopsis marina]SFB61145.1 hypothetical protein SAMN05216266_12746 [Amycolatopsis marina]